MSNWCFSLDFVMVMGILLDLARKKLKKRLFKRRELNGIWFKNLVHLSKEIKLRDKEEKRIRVEIPPGRTRRKME